MHRDQERHLHSWRPSHHHWPDRDHNPRGHLNHRLPKLHHFDSHRTKHIRHCGPKPNHVHCRYCRGKHRHPHRDIIRSDHHRHPIAIGRYLHCHPQPDYHCGRGSLHQQHRRANHLHNHPNPRPIRGRCYVHPSRCWYRRLRRRTKGNQHRRIQGCRQQALGCRCCRFPRSRCLPRVNGRRLHSLMTAPWVGNFWSRFLQTYLCVRVLGFKGMT